MANGLYSLRKLPLNPTTGTNKVPNQHSPGFTMVSTRDKTTVLSTEYERLQKEAAAAKEAKQELERASAEKKKYEKDLAQMKARLEAVSKQAPARVTPTGSKIKKEDLNEELVDMVRNLSKNYLFRYTKFVEDELQEKELAEEVYDYLKVDTGMDKAEFVAKYSNIVYQGIKAACSEAQQLGKTRAKGT